ncbi:hypothetical protein EJ110_NYTH28689 [Nymphaea thermarum]|nr:hypothetical protein EJ110_NYTH28689 [Nymphaea thermarum]
MDLKGHRWISLEEEPSGTGEFSEIDMTESFFTLAYREILAKGCPGHLEIAKKEETIFSSMFLLNFKDITGVYYSTRFSDALVQSDMKHWPFKVVAGPGDKPMIVVQYLTKEKHFTPEEISSMVLMKMRETAEAYLGTPWRTPLSPSLPTSMTPNGKPPKTPAPSPA